MPYEIVSSSSEDQGGANDFYDVVGVGATDLQPVEDVGQRHASTQVHNAPTVGEGFRQVGEDSRA
jgi:hypothetical protein